MLLRYFVPVRVKVCEAVFTSACRPVEVIKVTVTLQTEGRQTAPQDYNNVSVRAPQSGCEVALCEDYLLAHDYK